MARKQKPISTLDRTKIALIGNTGRLGSAIEAMLRQNFASEIEVVWQVDRSRLDDFCKYARQKHIQTEVDVILDVSLPEATLKILESLRKSKSHIPYVIGCTGWTKNQEKSIHRHAVSAPVIQAPNFSIGVNLVMDLLRRSNPVIKALGFDTILHEVHHTKKLDAPSGTAKAMISELPDLKIQVHSSRAGNVIGTHSVDFVGPQEIITIRHEALDRSIFAHGAILAAKWSAAVGRPGMFTMRDVIFGLDDRG